MDKIKENEKRVMELEYKITEIIKILKIQSESIKIFKDLVKDASQIETEEYLNYRFIGLAW